MIRAFDANNVELSVGDLVVRVTENLISPIIYEIQAIGELHQTNPMVIKPLHGTNRSFAYSYAVQLAEPEQLL